MSFPDHVSLSKEIKDLLRGLLCKDPRLRLGSLHGIKEIMAHPWFKGYRLKDIIARKFDPPYRPPILEFNIDEEEFSKGEMENPL